MITSWKSKNENLIPNVDNLYDILREKERQYQQSINKSFRETHVECGRVYWYDHELTEEEFETLHKECVCKHQEIFDEAFENNTYIGVCDLGHSFTTKNASVLKKGGKVVSVTLEKSSRKCKQCLEIFRYNPNPPENTELSEETKKTLKGLDNIAKAQAGMKYGFK